MRRKNHQGDWVMVRERGNAKSGENRAVRLQQVGDTAAALCLGFVDKMEEDLPRPKSNSTSIAGFIKSPLTIFIVSFFILRKSNSKFPMKTR